MKILELGLESSIATIVADKHMVIGCRATSAEDLFEFIDCEAPQVIVVDIDVHGWFFDEVKDLRHLQVRVPVVGLVSPSSVTHRERRGVFLERGGNDLLEKPIHTRELLATMNSLSKLSSWCIPEDTIEVKSGNATIMIDIEKRRITVDGGLLRLTYMEYQIFELLILHKDQIVSVTKIENTLYGFMKTPEYNSIQVMLARIRKKLIAIHPDTSRLIETIKRCGYRMNAP